MTFVHESSSSMIESKPSINRCPAVVAESPHRVVVRNPGLVVLHAAVHQRHELEGVQLFRYFSLRLCKLRNAFLSLGVSGRTSREKEIR